MLCTEFIGSNLETCSMIPLTYCSLSDIVFRGQRLQVGQFVSIWCSAPTTFQTPQQSMFYNPNERVRKIVTFAQH